MRQGRPTEGLELGALLVVRLLVRLEPTVRLSCICSAAAMAAMARASAGESVMEMTCWCGPGEPGSFGLSAAVTPGQGRRAESQVAK